MKNYLQELINNYYPSAYFTLYFSGLNKFNSVIDLGCGFGSVLKCFNNKYKLGVEVFEDYIEESRNKNIHHDYILENILSPKITSLLNNFEAIVCFDVLEHLEYQEAVNLVDEIEKSNPKFIAFRTPSTFVHQEEYHNNKYQIHKSAIDPEFFKQRGYRVFGVDGPNFMLLKNGRVVNDMPIYKLIFSYILRPIYYFLPEKSLNYIAIKKQLDV
jgi:SAM-dependent methyltransferase